MAKTNRDSAMKAIRAAWSHILYTVKSETAGKPFDLEHSLISYRDRAAIPVTVSDKAKADGIALERLGTERLWHAIKMIWPDDRPHLTNGKIADWFAPYVYLPKIRDKVVHEGSIREAVAKLDPQFGFADGFDETTRKYHKLIWARNPPEFASATAMIVREAEAGCECDHLINNSHRRVSIRRFTRSFERQFLPLLMETRERKPLSSVAEWACSEAGYSSPKRRGEQNVARTRAQ